MRCADEGGLGGTVEIARRKCRTFLSTFCQLNYIKHGSSPTQCVVATPKVGHLPQAGPSVRESVVSIELCNFESIIFLYSGRGWRPRNELHWKETPAWPHREVTGAGGCAVTRPPLSSFFEEKCSFCRPAQPCMCNQRGVKLSHSRCYRRVLPPPFSEGTIWSEIPSLLFCAQKTNAFSFAIQPAYLT